MSTSELQVAPTKPIRRVVTGHSEDGRSIVLVDEDVTPKPFLGKGPSFMSDIFWSDSAPVDNGVEWKDTITEHVGEHVGPAGSSFRVVDLPPGQVSPFHRTVTLDYGIVTQGTLTMILNNKKRVTLNAGDIFVQRGTIHGWHNAGTEWVRMYCIMLPAQKVEIGSQKLEPEFQPPRK